MSKLNNSVKDPVCGMSVTPDKNAITYQQMHFAFCSLQCQERFLASPHLYIGYPGQKSPKQEGKVFLKQRRIELDKPLTSQMSRKISEALQAMMGIEKVEIIGNNINVTYDLLQATEAQIESEITQAGAKLGQEWSERLKRAFVNYLEESEIKNQAVTPPARTGGHSH
tara:strand:- start:26714 stop:27217 length:504 start_codon:yes stop_codon:yes gene_type:complete